MIPLQLSAVILVLTIVCRPSCQQSSFASTTPEPPSSSKAAVQVIPNDVQGPSELLKRDLSGDVVHEATLTYPKAGSSQVTSYRVPRTNDFEGQQHVYVLPGRRKNKNWKLPPEIMKGISPSDSKVSWSFWETDDSEYWPEPDDADDSRPPMTEPPTTTTTTTQAPTTLPSTTKADKGPVSIHKHFHYFKKAAPWKGPMPPDEVMKMTEEMVAEMMKGMMMPPEAMPPMMMPEKKGSLSKILWKLSNVDPVTVLVAGIIPASLILAAALPSVMNKMMNGNKGDTTMMPPMMTPMAMTTAMPPAMDTTTMAPGKRQHREQEPPSMNQIFQAVSKFGLQALKDPRCARKMFCQLAKHSLLSDAPEFQRALRIATVAMQDSWMDVLGVRDIIHSLSQGTCDEAHCEANEAHDLTETQIPTQPTPPA